MRESCSCGAGIQTHSYRRVKEWRRAHLHTPSDPAAELEQMAQDQEFADIFLADEEENE